jgi:hypothetical protein
MRVATIRFIGEEEEEKSGLAVEAGESLSQKRAWWGRPRAGVLTFRERFDAGATFASRQWDAQQRNNNFLPAAGFLSFFRGKTAASPASAPFFAIER